MVTLIKKIIIFFIVISVAFIGTKIPTENDTEHERMKKIVFIFSIYGADRLDVENPVIKNTVDETRNFIDEVLKSSGLGSLRWKNANYRFKSAQNKLREYEKINNL